MLFLKRNMHFNELLRCDVSGLPIIHLDYYYEDDEDGLIIKFEIYQRLKRQKKRKEWDWSRLNQLSDAAEYKAALQDYEREMLSEDVLERKVFKGE